MSSENTDPSVNPYNIYQDCYAGEDSSDPYQPASKYRDMKDNPGVGSFMFLL
jgi:hypothetical protein